MPQLFPPNLFWSKFRLGTNIFWAQNILDPTYLAKNIFGPKKFWTQNFYPNLGPKFFWTWNFLDLIFSLSKSFWTRRFLTNIFELKFLHTKFFLLNIFVPKIFGSKIIWNQLFLNLKFLDSPKCLLFNFFRPKIVWTQIIFYCFWMKKLLSIYFLNKNILDNMYFTKKSWKLFSVRVRGIWNSSPPPPDFFSCCAS